jgi:hypothetical protein
LREIGFKCAELRNISTPCWRLGIANKAVEPLVRDPC